MSALHDALDEPLAGGCTAGAREFLPPVVSAMVPPFSLPVDPFAGMRRELDAFAWSLFGRMVEESARGEIPLDRDEGSL